MAASQGTGEPGPCGAVPPKPVETPPSGGLPLPEASYQMVDLQPAGAVEHDQGVDSAGGEGDAGVRLFGASAHGHGLRARGDGLIGADVRELQAAREHRGAEGDVDHLLFQGRLDHTHQGLPWRRGQLVVEDLEPQAGFWSHARDRVGLAGRDRHAGGQDGLAARGCARGPHGHAVVPRLDRLVGRDRAVGDVMEHDHGVGVVEGVQVHVDGGRVRRQVSEPDPARARGRGGREGRGGGGNAQQQGRRGQQHEQSSG